MKKIRDTHPQTTPTNPNTVNAKTYVRYLAVVLLLSAGMPGLSLAGEKEAAKHLSLWQTIDTLSQQIPFSKQKIETVLATELTEAVNKSNKLFHFFKSPPVVLSGGVVISNVDLRIKREGSHPGFLVLEIGGACITLEQIQEKYSELQISQLPRGQSPNEETGHSQLLPWGKLSLGFKAKNPLCLASVSFEPKKQ
ncbi:MAG: hypothetical protein FWC28_07870 [Proteobacteria bacterium]|nr:hypothetical protein [Cystobacterineae bacterium]MCL2258573.1 hypothetical protein [Cystobacterineae bacterium]MCL2315148.1 hypothetical protein [Pseudomonadota bacterium]